MSETDPFDTESQQQVQGDKALRARLEAETEEADFAWLMSRKRGRRIVWRLLEQAGVFRSSFSPTAMLMAFNEGNRNYGLRTLALIQTSCQDLYSQMVKENTDARTDAQSK